MKMEINKEELKKALEEVETEETQEQKELKEVKNEQQPTADLSDFKPYITLIHTKLFKIAKKDVEKDLIGELDKCLIKILEKRLPKVAGVLNNSPEITYLMLLGSTFVMTPTQKPQQLPQNTEFTGIEKNE